MKRKFLLVSALVLTLTATALALTPKQKGLFEFWRTNARETCGAEWKSWDKSVAKLTKLLGKRSGPESLKEWQAFSEMWQTRAALAECKGDYWLHFLITPDLICKDQPFPKGAR